MSAEALEPEEQARANLYGLLARLFYAPPDRELLASLAASGEIAAEDAHSPFAGAWRALKSAAAAADVETLREEYEGVFVGTGKAEVTLYSGAYTVRTALDNPLVTLREFLAANRLVRRDNVTEPEDHLAALFETMRHLIATKRDYALQQAFFSRFVWPAANPLCDAIAASPNTRFYKTIGSVAKSFCALEHSAFEME